MLSPIHTHIVFRNYILLSFVHVCYNIDVEHKISYQLSFVCMFTELGMHGDFSPLATHGHIC
jgi:hypothetical protein